MNTSEKYGARAEKEEDWQRMSWVASYKATRWHVLGFRFWRHQTTPSYRGQVEMDEANKDAASSTAGSPRRIVISAWAWARISE